MNSSFSSLFGRKGFRTSVIANFPFLYMWQRKTLEAFAFPFLSSSWSRRSLCYFLASWTCVGFGDRGAGKRWWETDWKRQEEKEPHGSKWEVRCRHMRAKEGAWDRARGGEREWVVSVLRNRHFGKREMFQNVNNFKEDLAEWVYGNRLLVAPFRANEDLMTS